MKENRTTIQIESETLELLRSKLEYTKRNGKHFLETYDDLIQRLIKEYKETTKNIKEDAL